MAFHLGKDAFLSDISLTLHNNLETGDNDLEIAVDVAKFFTNIDLSTEFSTHVGDNIPLAEKFKANLPGAFSTK